MKMTIAAKSRLLVGTAAATVTLLLLSCSPEGASMNAQVLSGGRSAEIEPVVNVRVDTVDQGRLEERITLSGEVHATGRVNAVPEISGLLTRVLVVPGDAVAFNQIIAYVDPSKPGMSYAESPVRSKASGTVTSVPAVPGNQVSVQSVIAEVGDLSRLEVEIPVPEKYLASLEVGMTGWVTSRSFPDVEEPARVIELSPVVDPVSRTVLVTLEPESTRRLRPGQAVRVDLVLDVRDDAVTIPAAALTERRDGTGVFVVTGDAVAWRPISTGAVDAGRLEVLTGLDGGERVVVAGIEDVTDGTRIHVLEG